MRVFVVEPPEPVVTFAEAVIRLKLSGETDEQADVENMISAATAIIDGPDGWLARSIGIQTLEARIDSFTCARSILLPYPPVVAVISVKYIDADGVEQTIAPADYDLLGTEVVPAPGKSWPSPRSQREAVRILYDAGYEEVPPNVKSAILIMAGDQYKKRNTAPELSMAAENLLRTLRVYR